MAINELTKTLTTEKTTKTNALVAEVYEALKRENIRIVDFKFTDLFGQWQHFSIPTGELTENIFEEGIGFDGSSIKGFQEIHESDMLLLPDPGSIFVDPYSTSTLSIQTNVLDPMANKMYSRDPRYVAQKAEAYLKETGIADTSYWGPEPEFFIFDNIQYNQNEYSGYYRIDSKDKIRKSGKDENN